MHTNQVASNCAVCGKYLAVGSGVSAGGDDPRTFCHPGCAEAIAPQTAAAIAVVRPNHRWSGSEQLEREDRRASGTRHAVRPRVAGVSGGLAMLVGLALLLVASGEDDDGPSSRPVGGSAPEVSALGVTETTPEQDASSAAKSPIGADPADGPAARARPRGSVTSRNPKAAPPLVPAPDDQAPPSSGGSGSPTAPSGTVSSSPPSSGPPTTDPPTTSPPPSDPSTTSEAPTTTTEPSTTTEPPTTTPTTAPTTTPTTTDPTTAPSSPSTTDPAPSTEPSTSTSGAPRTSESPSTPGGSPEQPSPPSAPLSTLDDLVGGLLRVLF